MSLGQNFASDAMAAFSGELYAATLTTQAETVYDVNNPTGGPSSVPVDHACEAFAFTYQQADIDGTRVVKGDYRVVILRGSLDVIPVPGNTISVPPPGSAVAKVARVVNIEVVTEAQITVQVRG